MLLVLAVGPAALAATPPGGQPGQTGTVDTILGPGFCDGSGALDPGSTTVRALAVDGDGRIFVDTGPVDQGAVGVVDDTGQARLVGTASPPTPAGSRAGLRLPDRAGPPGRLAPDGEDGVLLAADTHILQVSAAGGQRLVAGNPTVAGRSGGDGGPAADADFTRILAVATDTAGNAYVADEVDGDQSTFRLRVVNRSTQPVPLTDGTGGQITVAPGHIDTIAGGQPAGGQRGAPAAPLQGQPPALAVGDGLVYVGLYASTATAVRPTARVDAMNVSSEPVTAHGVRVAPGQIETVAGGGAAGEGGDGGPARSAAFGMLPGIAVDDEGNLYLADEANDRIRRVDDTGTISTYAGTGSGGFNGNDRAATQALLHSPWDVAVGPGGQVYLSDRLNGQVRFVDEAGALRAAPGNGVGLTWACDSDDGEAAAEPARPDQPAGLATDGHGMAYLALPGLSQVQRFTTASGQETDEAGLVTVEQSAVDVPAAGAIAVAPGGGGLYVADAAGAVRYANLTTSPTRIHGVPVAPTTDEVVAEAAELRAFGTAALAADGDGNLFVLDDVTRSVVHIDRGGERTTVIESVSTRDPSVCCRLLAGLVVDAAGNLYTSERHRVWFTNRATAPVTVHGQTVQPGATEPVAGTGDAGFEGDAGPALEADFTSSGGMATDDDGSLFVADNQEHTVRKIDRDGTISTVVGTGSSGFNGDGLAAARTTLAGPGAVAVDECGNLLVADAGNHRIRRVNLVGGCESTPAVDEATPVGMSTLTLVGTGVAVAAVVGVGVGLAVAAVLRRRSGA